MDKVIGALFITGILLLVWQINIYRTTIIDLRIPLLVWLSPGVILTPLFYQKLNRIDGMKAHWVLHYVLHTCIAGAFLLFTFMATNFWFADDQVTTKTFKIVRKGSMAGSKGHRDKRTPYVIINYEGLDKQLVFSFDHTAEIQRAKTIKVVAKEGLWGFDVLVRYDVD